MWRCASRAKETVEWRPSNRLRANRRSTSFRDCQAAVNRRCRNGCRRASARRICASIRSNRRCATCARSSVEGEGYRLAYRIARDNLLVGTSVVADSCNPIELTRREWEQVARDAGARYVNIEVVCSDAREHRTRAEQRAAEVPGLSQPTWHEIEHREYDAWTVDRIVVDTAGRSIAECERELLARLPVAANDSSKGQRPLR